MEITPYPAANAKERTTRCGGTSERRGGGRHDLTGHDNLRGLLSGALRSKGRVRSLGGRIRHQQPPREPWARLLPDNKDGQLSSKETHQVVPAIASAQGSELCPLQSEKAFAFNTLRMSVNPPLVAFFSVYMWFSSLWKGQGIFH